MSSVTLTTIAMRGNAASMRQFGQLVNPAVLALLLAGDAAFVLLHLANKLLPSANALFSLNSDGGYSEVFQHLKAYWVVIALATLCRRTREGIHGAWALLFLYLLLDDALHVHETVGAFIAREWNYVPAIGLRARDFGELTVSMMAGSAFLALIACFHLRCSNDARNSSKDLALLLGLLVFFGVLVDMMHVVVNGLTIVEEGGELAAMSLITAYVIRLLGMQGMPRIRCGN
jgi:hypothetical protein